MALMIEPYMMRLKLLFISTILIGLLMGWGLMKRILHGRGKTQTYLSTVNIAKATVVA